MQANLFRHSRPGLLVSVRSAAEATAALAGGADVIDVKEPTRGSLGSADWVTIQGVVRVVNGTVPVTAAMGELVDLQNGPANEQQSIPGGVKAFKIGLAGCANWGGWRSNWRQAIKRINGNCTLSMPRPVGVAYADWQAAASPRPHEVLNAAYELSCAAILVDTWSKSSGSLFEHWPPDDLHKFIKTARAGSMSVVLAGSLRGADMSLAASLAPDLVAVRAAACDDGRNGTISTDRVRQLKETIAAAELLSELNALAP